MKKPIVFLIICIFIGGIASAQSITFCKSVDAAGHAVNAGREFTLGKSGSQLVFLLQFNNAKPANVSYDLYNVEKGKEVFNSTMKQTPAAGKDWLAKEVTLYEAGNYRVYVYDDRDQLLSKSDFVIKPIAQ